MPFPPVISVIFAWNDVIKTTKTLMKNSNFPPDIDDTGTRQSPVVLYHFSDLQGRLMPNFHVFANGTFPSNTTQEHARSML